MKVKLAMIKFQFVFVVLLLFVKSSYSLYYGKLEENISINCVIPIMGSYDLIKQENLKAISSDIKVIQNFDPKDTGINLLSHQNNLYVNNMFPMGRVFNLYEGKKCFQLSSILLTDTEKNLLYNSETIARIYQGLQIKYKNITAYSLDNINCYSQLLNLNFEADIDIDLYANFLIGLYTNTSDKDLDVEANIMNLSRDELHQKHLEKINYIKEAIPICKRFQELFHDEDFNDFKNAVYELGIRDINKISLNEFFELAKKRAEEICLQYMLKCNDYLNFFGVSFSEEEINDLRESPLYFAPELAIRYRDNIHTEKLLYYHLTKKNELKYPIIFVSWLYMCPSCKDLWAKSTPEENGKINTCVVSLYDYSRKAKQTSNINRSFMGIRVSSYTEQ